MNEKQTTALSVGIVVLVAMGISALILWDLSNRERRQLEDGRNLSPADLSKVTLEPIGIGGKSYLSRVYLNFRLYNGTNRPLVEAQVTLYVRMYGDEIWGRAKAQKKTERTFEEVWEEVHEAERWRNAKSAPSAESAREYKQEFDRIGPVPPNSWYEGSIRLSNCPSEVTYTPDGVAPAQWRVILNDAKWKKQKESSLCAVAANWRYLAFPAAAVVLIVGGLIFTLRDRVPKAANDLTEKQPRNPVEKSVLSHSYASLPSHPDRRASVGEAVKSDTVDDRETEFEPEDREKNGQPEIEAGVLGYSVVADREVPGIEKPQNRVGLSAAPSVGGASTARRCPMQHSSNVPSGMSQRWPWKRVARRTYTWWEWIGVLFVLGGLGTLSNFAEMMTFKGQLDSSVALMMWISLLIQVSIIVAFAFAYRKMLYDPTEGGKIIIYGYIALAGLGTAKIFFGMFVLDSGSILARSTQVQGWAILVLGLLFARSAQSLTYPRFAQLARLLDRLYRSGVPKSFMKKYNDGNLLVRGTYAIQPDEPKESMPLNKLYRAVAVGKVVLPDKVEYGG